MKLPKICEKRRFKIYYSIHNLYNIFEPNHFAIAFHPFILMEAFKMVSFLEHLAFSEWLFCTELLQCCRIDFCMVAGILFFLAKLTILQRLQPLICMMADFQNGLISRIFSVLSSGFLHRTTLWQQNRFLHAF